MNLNVPFNPVPKPKALRLKSDREKRMRQARDLTWARDRLYGTKGNEVAACHFCRKEVERGERQGEVHHLKKRSTHPELRYELSNLVIACTRCHDEQHGTRQRKRKRNA